MSKLQKSNSTNPDITAVVVNYNTAEFCNNAVESILTTSPDITKEVILVDNGSSDNSVGIIKKKWGQKVLLIENKENHGFAKANNQALRQANGRYFFLLNSDAEVIGDAIEKMVSFADANQRVGVLGCKIVSQSGEQQSSCWRTYNLQYLFCRAFNLDRMVPNGIFGRSNIETYSKRNNSGPVEVVSGCSMLVRNSAAAKVGLFDERFFMYCEDMEWCTRMRKAGFEVYFLSNASVRHYYGGGTIANMRYEMLLEQSKSILKFMRKEYGTGTAFLANIFLWLYFAMRLPYWLFRSIIGENKSRSRDVAKAYIAISCWHMLYPLLAK